MQFNESGTRSSALSYVTGPQPMSSLLILIFIDLNFNSLSNKINVVLWNIYAVNSTRSSDQSLLRGCFMELKTFIILVSMLYSIALHKYVATTDW